jgi:UDP-N-acetylglucosamine 2-epimerase (non-hydrolysing)
MKVLTVVGARPNFIKMAPVSGELKKSMTEVIVHTGQHYDYELDKIFFDELRIPAPDYHLGVGSGSHGYQTGEMLKKIDGIIASEKPDFVLVYGDTNSTLAGALGAAKMHVPVAHVEAGLRSFDRRMPEEINRVLTDHLSDLLFAPTVAAKEMLLREGIPESRVFVTGNTIVDAVRENLGLAGRKVLPKLGLAPKSYLLSTLHRQENVDSRERLGEIFRGLGMVSAECGLPVVLPVHPRTRKMIEAFGVKMPDGIRLIEPIGFLEFLEAEANARLVLTDSGGVQEEACILGVPCVTIRENTERPETVEVGANTLAGYRSGGIRQAALKMLSAGDGWQNPFGDGTAGRQIVDLSTGVMPAAERDCYRDADYDYRGAIGQKLRT